MKWKTYIQHWMQIIRAQYLVLCVVLSIIGNGVAWFENSFRWSSAILSLVGLLFAHISVNVLNDYFDHRSGIDQKTNRSPFNGGSGSIQSSIISPKTTLAVGLIFLALAGVVGLYFVYTIPTGWQLIPLILVAGTIVTLYSPVLLKWVGGEWSAGIGLGALPVIGTYFVQTGHYSLLIFLASIPSLILVHNLLFINEFPDVEADQIGTRKTFPIVFGIERSIWFYKLTLVLLYIFIAENVLLGFFPLYSMLALLTIPMATKTKTLLSLPTNSFQPMMQFNVGIVLLTQFLFGIGFVISGFVW
ncbi:MAG: prenyltransferase [Caldisericia bacterium]|nr:prenyltransferase [Caldisericia bacterium]MDD4614489.1 prenyltransferase [Caldisericia bacterium]